MKKLFLILVFLPFLSLGQDMITKQSKELGIAIKEQFKEPVETDTVLSINPLLASVFWPQNQKFLKNWMNFNPTDEIKKIGKPILIIQGEQDLQLGMDDAKNLLKACINNAISSQLVAVDEMNHVLKTIKNQQEHVQFYTDSKFPLSRELIKSIATFILEHE